MNNNNNNTQGGTGKWVKMVQDIMDFLEQATRSKLKAKKLVGKKGTSAAAKTTTTTAAAAVVGGATAAQAAVSKVYQDMLIGANKTKTRKDQINSQVASAFGEHSWEWWSKTQTLNTATYVVGVVGACLVAEKTTGCVSYSLKYLNRYWERWIADTASPPLFTPEGEEPQPLVPKWKLPFMKSRKFANNSNSSSTGRVHYDESSIKSHELSESATQLDQSTTIYASSNSNNSSARTLSSSMHSHLSTTSTTNQSDMKTDSSGDLPHFFSSTKLLACLDLEDSRELFESAKIIRLGPEETLFHSGDTSEGGTYIVVEGSLGVFLHDVEGEGSPPMHTNTLQEGESVGDLDIVDGDKRSVTCVALEEGAVLVEISRKLFMEFVIQKPRALQVYLQQAIARLWRVASFVLNDTLRIPQSKGKHEMFDTVPSTKVGLLDGELLSLLLEGQVGHYMCLPAGQSLYEEGTPADAFYILLRGKMLIEKCCEKASLQSPGGTAKQSTADIVSPPVHDRVRGLLHKHGQEAVCEGTGAV